MLLLALVSPIIVLGFLFLMQGFERWMLGAEPVTVRARPNPAHADRDASSNTPRTGQLLQPEEGQRNVSLLILSGLPPKPRESDGELRLSVLPAGREQGWRTGYAGRQRTERGHPCTVTLPVGTD
jgi:hypothetical protein